MMWSCLTPAEEASVGAYRRYYTHTHFLRRTATVSADVLTDTGCRACVGRVAEGEVDMTDVG
jgi:hypothetical protein